jgi:hypothetical protein
MPPLRAILQAQTARKVKLAGLQLRRMATDK